MKILVIFTGGTIGSILNDGVISPNIKSRSVLLDNYIRENDGVCFETVEAYNILSENLSAVHLNALHNCVTSHIGADFDGIIITHGTDTLQYTTAFLSLTLKYLNMPVVTVSANYPLFDSRTNGHLNFSAAVDFIRQSKKAGVFSVYANEGENPKLHYGTRLLPHMPFSDRIESLGGCLGEIFGGKFIENKSCPPLGQLEPEALDFIGLSEMPKVAFVRAYPGMIFPELSKNVKNVLIEGYHSGTLPTSSEDFISFCKSANQKGIAVWLTGSCDGFNYESKVTFEKLKIKVLPPMSPITAYIYLILLSDI